MPDMEKVINKVKAIVADMQEEVDEWKDYSDSELRGGLTCDCDWWYKTLQTLKDALALLKAQEPIDAIPVEWLLKTSERVLNTTGQKLVDAMIERWQKEQEAQDG